MPLTLPLAPQEKCHQYWPAERSARYQYFVVDPMAEYNMPQYILREFKVTDARVSGPQQRLEQCSGGVFTRVGAAWHSLALLGALVDFSDHHQLWGLCGQLAFTEGGILDIDNQGSHGNNHIVCGRHR